MYLQITYNPCNFVKLTLESSLFVVTVGTVVAKNDSLVWEFVDMQRDRTSLVSLLVFLRRVQVSLCVACVIGHPQRHWSSCDGNLKQQTKKNNRKSNRSFLKKNKTKKTYIMIISLKIRLQNILVIMITCYNSVKLC